MFCTRCGAPASGARCAACGESLAFAPPQAGVDGPAAGLAPVGEGSGWLIAAGVVQILLGVGWIGMGVVFLFVSRSGDVFAAFTQQLGQASESFRNAIGVVFAVCAAIGALMIVISSFVVARHRWAWVVSLVFDALWALVGLLAFTKSAQAGVVYLAISGGLISFLVAGRQALRD